VAAIAAVFAVSAFVPAVAFGQGNVVKDLVKGVQDSVSGLLGGGGAGGGSTGGDQSVEPQAGAPPNYTPPLHGSNPHGQGNVATVDLNPDNALPQPGDVDQGETITVGQARGEQDANGNYHGRVILLDENLVNLIQIGVETDEGETANGPLEPVQELLDAACGVLSLGPDGCITVLAMNSETTSTGSTNSFVLASTDIGLNLGGVGIGLDTSTASSSGNISEDSTCQTATGTSNVEDASLALGAQTLSADALQSSSESQACNNGTQSVNQESTVVNLNNEPLALPLLFSQNCANGVPDSSAAVIPVILELVCNADDSNSGQTAIPYGVREALSAFVLIIGGNPLIKATTAGAESHAVAPPATVTPQPPGVTTPGDGGDGRDGRDGGDGRDDGAGGGAGGAAGDAQAPDEDLAFTGANMLWLALIGSMLIAGGLGLARASTRRSRRLTA
jgi:hypothetical protein